MTETNERKPININRILVSVIALLLSAAMLMEIPAAAVETEIYANTYISDVEIFTGDSVKSAVASCKNAGFIPVEKNINRWEADDEDEGIYILGYKTTNNQKDGITGLSMLQMNMGYQDYSYGNIAEFEIDALGNLPDEIMMSVDEMRDNLASGSPAARAALEVLNCYRIDDAEDSELLGNYLMYGGGDKAFIKKLMARSSSSLVATLCNALSAGVAEYGGDNWAVRLSESAELQARLDDEDSFAALDNNYKIYASELTDSLQSFADAVHDAIATYEKNNASVPVPVSDGLSETEVSDEMMEAATNGGIINTDDACGFYLYIYDLLNQYRYSETMTVGEYLVSLGDRDYKSVEDLRPIYPFVDSLTNGEVAVMRLCGIAVTSVFLVNEDALSEKAELFLAEAKEKISKCGKNGTLSIWDGTDQTVYNEKVALTTEAFRSNQAGKIYESLTHPDELDNDLSEAMKYLECIMTVVGVAYGITVLTATVVSYMFGFAVWAGTSSVIAICWAGVGSGVIGTILGLLGCTAIILNYVALAAMFVILVVMLVKYIYDLIVDKDDEEFTEIPRIIYDAVNNRYVRYEAIKLHGKPANINGNEARRWNALYYTKSSLIGEPICSGDASDLIAVQYDNSAVPTGYTAVRCFGEYTPANLNANTDDDACDIFLFCKKTATEINDGAPQNGDKYLSKLSLSVGNTETEAKANLTKTGFSVIDVNLCPMTGYYTYLGFQTTPSEKDALTDIRVAPRSSGASFLFGNASYSSCGTTPTGDTIYYTSYDSAGTPILADIAVKYALSEAPEGYEPVNMFCGGNAYNFNVGQDEFPRNCTEYDHWNDKGRYLYFRPSVAYTEGAEYLSGIVLIAGKDTDKGKDTAEDYANVLGLRMLDGDLTYGLAAQTVKVLGGGQTLTQTWSGVETRICYSTTHNPYRAIYGIRSYTNAPGNMTMTPFLGSIERGAYAVADVFFELPYVCAGKDSIENYSRGIYDTHSYYFASCAGEESGVMHMSAYVEMLPEDYETVSWQHSSIRGKGLYVLGPTAGASPLTVNDIFLSNSAEIPEGFVSVQDFKTPNRTEAHNLGYKEYTKKYADKTTTPLYLYIKGAKPVEKKYISSIAVSTYSMNKVVAEADISKLDANQKRTVNEMCNDLCMAELITSCTDEIIPGNLAVPTEDSFYADTGYDTYKASYIGVSRTNQSKDAITAIIRYRTNEKTVPNRISVGGIEYTKAGEKINDAKGGYFLYYTRATGTNPGAPITAITVSGEVFENAMATAMTTAGEDIPAKKSGGVVVSEEQEAVLYGDSQTSEYVHMAFEDKTSMMTSICIGHGKTENDAKCDLLSLGCNMALDMNLNREAGGENVFIGYTRYVPTSSEKKKGNYRFAIRDILLTVGEEHHETLELDGVTYYCADDDFSVKEDSDGTQGVSLNQGAGGKKIFVYYTYTATEGTETPIEKLGIACRDYGMLDTDTNVWENVLDKNGKLVNLNDGVIKTTDDGRHMVDNRMYLFATRLNNAVKPGARVSRSIMSGTFTEYDVYIKGR